MANVIKKVGEINRGGVVSYHIAYYNEETQRAESFVVPLSAFTNEEKLQINDILTLFLSKK